MPGFKKSPIEAKRALIQDQRIFDFSGVGIGRPTTLRETGERLRTAKRFRDRLTEMRMTRLTTNRASAYLVLGLTQKQVGRLIRSPDGKRVSPERVRQSVRRALMEARRDPRHFF